MQESLICGSGRIIKTKYGEMTKVSFNKNDINKIVAYMKENKNDWINLILKERRNKVEGKPTHYLEIDTWNPSTNQQPDKDDFVF